MKLFLFPALEVGCVNTLVCLRLRENHCNLEKGCKRHFQAIMFPVFVSRLTKKCRHFIENQQTETRKKYCVVAKHLWSRVCGVLAFHEIIFPTPFSNAILLSLIFFFRYRKKSAFHIIDDGFLVSEVLSGFFPEYGHTCTECARRTYIEITFLILFSLFYPPWTRMHKYQQFELAKPCFDSTALKPVDIESFPRPGIISRVNVTCVSLTEKLILQVVATFKKIRSSN